MIVKQLTALEMAGILFFTKHRAELTDATRRIRCHKSCIGTLINRIRNTISALIDELI